MPKAPAFKITYFYNTSCISCIFRMVRNSIPVSFWQNLAQAVHMVCPGPCGASGQVWAGAGHRAENGTVEVEEEEHGAPKTECCRRMRARRAPPEGETWFAGAPEVAARTGRQLRGWARERGRSASAEEAAGGVARERRSMRTARGRSSSRRRLRHHHSGPRGTSTAAGNLGKGPDWKEVGLEEECSEELSEELGARSGHGPPAPPPLWHRRFTGVQTLEALGRQVYR